MFGRGGMRVGGMWWGWRRRFGSEYLTLVSKMLVGFEDVG